jgi:cyclic lactone autoinducer peptide
MNQKRVVSLISKCLAAVAIVMVSTASWWLAYRPETPNELKKT